MTKYHNGPQNLKYGWACAHEETKQLHGCQLLDLGEHSGATAQLI